VAVASGSDSSDSNQTSIHIGLMISTPPRGALIEGWTPAQQAFCVTSTTGAGILNIVCGLTRFPTRQLSAAATSTTAYHRN